MSSETKRSPRRRVVKKVLILALLALALRYCYLYPMHGKLAEEYNEANQRQVDIVIAALHAYRAQAKRFPASLADLYPAYLSVFPRLVPGSALRYESSPQGDQCWLDLIPYYEAGFLLPSDRAGEYDCAARSWSNLDYNDLRAGDDGRWRELVKARAPVTLTVLGFRAAPLYEVLGWLEESAGRNVVEGGDVVERFYPEEREKAAQFRKALSTLMYAQGFETEIREELSDNGFTEFRSRPLAEALNTLYVERLTMGKALMPDGSQKPIAQAMVSAAMFAQAGPNDKLAYLRGAYRRYGSGQTFTFANARHKATLIAELLIELGCNDVVLDSSKDSIAQTNIVRYVPSEEVRDAILR